MQQESCKVPQTIKGNRENEGGVMGGQVNRKGPHWNEPKKDNSSQALVQDSPEAVSPLSLGFGAMEIAWETHTPKSSMAAMFGTREFIASVAGYYGRNNLISVHLGK